MRYNVTELHCNLKLYSSISICQNFWSHMTLKLSLFEVQNGVSFLWNYSWLFLCPKKFTKVNRHKKNCTSNCSLTLLLNEIKILKIWGTFLLPPVSYLKYIFYPVLASHYCQDIGLQNQVTRSLSNQKWNEFLKITI